MNSSSANAALRRMGYKGILVSHGLRAIASTALNEKGFAPDVIEAALWPWLYKLIVKFKLIN